MIHANLLLLSQPLIDRGNHDLWTTSDYDDSIKKWKANIELCKKCGVRYELMRRRSVPSKCSYTLQMDLDDKCHCAVCTGVSTSPELVMGQVWVVPLLAWYCDMVDKVRLQVTTESQLYGLQLGFDIAMRVSGWWAGNRSCSTARLDGLHKLQMAGHSRQTSVGCHSSAHNCCNHVELLRISFDLHQSLVRMVQIPSQLNTSRTCSWQADEETRRQKAAQNGGGPGMRRVGSKTWLPIDGTEVPSPRSTSIRDKMKEKLWMSEAVDEYFLRRNDEMLEKMLPKVSKRLDTACTHNRPALQQKQL